MIYLLQINIYYKLIYAVLKRSDFYGNRCNRFKSKNDNFNASV